MAFAQGEKQQQSSPLYSGKLEADLIIFDRMHGQKRYYDEFMSLPKNLQKEMSAYHKELLKSDQSPKAAAFWAANFLDRENSGQSPISYYNLTSSQMLALTKLAWDLIPEDISETIAKRQKRNAGASFFANAFRSEDTSKMTFAESSQVFDERQGNGNGTATMRWLLTSLHGAKGVTTSERHDMLTEKHYKIARSASEILPPGLLKQIYEKKTENIIN